MALDDLTPTFDPAVLSGIFGDDPELQREVVEVYLESIPRSAGALVAALQAEDWEQVSFHAHSLKGSAANLGAARVRFVAAELEVGSRHQEGTRCHRLRDPLEQELARLDAELRRRYPGVG
jgi:HPt (histidine-containing phosphotransfer) domain-containing protein